MRSGYVPRLLLPDVAGLHWQEVIGRTIRSMEWAAQLREFCQTLNPELEP